MAAAIDRKLEAIGRAEHRQLVDDELAAEIGRDEVARAVGYQRLQLAVARERVAQILNHFRADAATTPVPLAVDLAIEQAVGLLDPPLERALIKRGHGRGDRRADGVEH